MNLTTLGEIPRPVSRFSRVAVARVSDYCSFLKLCGQTVDQEGGSV